LKIYALWEGLITTSCDVQNSHVLLSTDLFYLDLGCRKLCHSSFQKFASRTGLNLNLIDLFCCVNVVICLCLKMYWLNKSKYECGIRRISTRPALLLARQMLILSVEWQFIEHLFPLPCTSYTTHSL